MTPIIEEFFLAATDSDLLGSGRLNAIPYNGLLTLQALADLGGATNFFQWSVQLAAGDVPIDLQRVPASGSGLDGVLDEREFIQVTYRVARGGHVTVNCVENGTATMAVRAILKPG